MRKLLNVFLLICLHIKELIPPPKRHTYTVITKKKNNCQWVLKLISKMYN